jgi:predicted anti-sigma-YlaC factor YlaD
MQCLPYREALSARLDGESPGMPEDALDAHLAGCPRCVAWADAAARVTRRARLAPAPPVPDLTAAVLAALPLRSAGAAARAERNGLLLRIALALLGAAQAGLGTPALQIGAGAMSAPAHMMHETGAWNLGVAAAFLAVAAWPRLAAGALPFLGTFTLLLAVATVSDLVAGRVPLDRAAGHALLVLGVLLTAVIAWRQRPCGAAGAVARDRVPA